MAFTASQIVADALAIAKCPGYTAQGGRALNYVLADLSMHRNLKVNLVTATLTVSANNVGPYSLESDYLRTFELTYTAGGVPYFLNPCTIKEFDADNIPAAGTSYPDEYATDLSPVATGGVGQIYIYPPSNQTIAMTHRYFLKRADIATPETSSAIPWFEDQDYLLTATAMRMMRITDDARLDRFEADAEAMLRKHLMTEGDEQQVVKSVQLDPRRFRSGAGVKATKGSPF